MEVIFIFIPFFFFYQLHFSCALDCLLSIDCFWHGDLDFLAVLSIVIDLDHQWLS